MFKLILSILLTSLLFSKPTITPKIVPLFEPFLIKDKNLTFDTDVLYTHKKLLECNPQLDAVYKIIDSHELKVIPTKWLKRDTKYSCKYQGHEFSFQTQPLEILNYHYFPDSNLVRIEFNDKIDPKLAKEYIHIRKQNKLAQTELKYSIEVDKNRVLLKIEELISKDDTLRLSIDKALLKDGFDREINKKKSDKRVKLDDKLKMLDIWDKPRIISLDNGDFALRVFFSDYPEEDVNEFVYVDGVNRFDNYDCHTVYSPKNQNISYDSSVYCDFISSYFKPNKSYKVEIKKGLKISKRELKEDKTYTLKSGDIAKAIIVDDKKPYVSNRGEFGFSSINLDRVTIIVERLLDDNLRYFVNFKESNINVVGDFTSELFSKEVKLKNIPNKIIQHKFSLSELNKRTLPFGVYNITFRYQDGEKEKAISKVLFLSNIGISANISKTQAFIHVMHLDSAKPMVSAMVYLYGKNNDLIGSAKADKYGVVIIKDENLLAKNPRGIIVETKNDKNFLSLTEPIGDSPTFEDIIERKERFSAYIYPQSKIVRPESRINSLIIVKDKSFISAKNIPIKIEFKEKYGQTLLEKVYHTDNYGLIDFHYQLSKVDRTGDYTISAYINNVEIGSKDIKVKAFVPPKIENHIYLSKDIYFDGELLDANISSNYLFGSPASYLFGYITIDSTAIDFVDNKRYKGYSFSNHELEKESEDNKIDRYFYKKENIKLDSNGKINVVLPIRIKEKVPSILEGIIEATIIDDNQPVGEYKKFKIYPYKSMVGIKLNETHLEQGDNLTGKVVLINPVDKKIIKRELYGVVKQIEWHYNYDKYNSNWEREVKVINRFQIDSNSTFSIPIHKNGNFVIEITDRLNGHSASVPFSIWSENYTNISPKNDIGRVDISFDNKSYKEGDTLVATLTSPILEGNLVVSIEDDKIETYKVLNIEKGVARVELPINFKNRGAYLHAVVYSATNRSSKLIPFRAVGYKYIKPDKSSNKIKVNLYAPKETKSRSVVELTIDVNKKSKVLVSVVDKSILNLLKQKSPKIFEFFNQKEDKKVSYFDFYDLVMSYIAKGEMISFGAGDKLELKTKHLAPSLAKRIRPFMLWSGLLTPTNSSFKFPVGIPQFNGKVTAVVIAVNGDSVGVASRDIIVKDDIIIKPSFPKYLIKGDKLEVPVRIFNNSKKRRELNITDDFSKNLLFKLKDINGSSIISIAPNSSKVLKAELIAKEEGKGVVSIFAKYNGSISVYNIEIPIYTPYSISTKTFRGVIDKKEEFIVPPEYKNAEAYITLSDNILGVLRDDLKYLVNYPYGCLEQVTSKVLAIYYAQPFLKNDSLLRDSKRFIRQGIKKILDMKGFYGEFKYWNIDDENNINPYASLYASEAILDFYRAGMYVDDRYIEEILSTLKDIAQENKDKYFGKYNKFHRIYSAYILSKNNKLPSSILNILYKKGFYKENFLSSLYMSAILKMNGKTKEADELYASIPYSLSSYLEKKEYKNQDGDLGSNIRDMFLHFIIKTKYFNKNIKDLSIVEKAFDRLESTQEKAVALKAVSLFLDKPKRDDINVTLQLNKTNRVYTKPNIIYIDRIKSDKITITPNSGVVSYNIELIKPLPKILKNKLSKSKRLSIKREFIDKNGKKINLKELRWGDTIFSKITVANYGEIKNVVIDQRIPSCFSFVNSEISNKRFKNKNINLEYMDVRDDRVLYFIDLVKKEKYDKYTKKSTIEQNIGVIYTPLLVTSKGVCNNIAITAEAMYDSRINDYAKATNEIIVK